MQNKHIFSTATPSPPTQTVFGIIRHARTLWNIEKRIQGSTDNPLCTEGNSDALMWGQHIAEKKYGWQRIICSPLLRAKETALAINKSLLLPLSVDIRLREQNWGEWEGKTIKHLRQTTNGEIERQEAKGWDFTPTGGESRSEVRQRMFKALTDIARQHQGERILIVSHLSCIKSVIHTMLEQSGQPVIPDPLQKHGLHTLTYTDDMFSILSLNGPL